MKMLQHLTSISGNFYPVLLITVSFAWGPNLAAADDDLVHDKPAIAAEHRDQPSAIFRTGRDVVGLARVLETQFTSDDQVSLSVDPETNVLILRGSENMVSKAASMLNEIDQPPYTVNVKLTIAVDGDSSQDTASDQRVLDQLELATLSGNKARLQFGQQVVVPTGTTGATGFSGGRPPSRSYSQQQVGTLVQVEPRVTVHGIELQLEVEKSWLESKPATDIAESVANIVEQNTTFTTSLQTTLLLRDGEAQAVRAKVTSRAGDAKDVLITVSATTSKPVASVRAARVRQPASEQDASADTPSATPSTGSRSPQGIRGSSARGGFGGRGSNREGASGGRPGSPPAASEQGNRNDETIRRMFDQIDRNRDEKISQEELDAHPFSRSIATRGFVFSDDMSFEQFKPEFQKFLDQVRGTPRD